LYASPVGTGGKLLLAKIIQKFGHQDFEYLIFVWDDDLDVEHFNYENLIRIMRRNRLEVAQPALSNDSYYTHSLTLKKRGIGRYVDFVEITAHFFERDAWPAYWKMVERNGDFWGYGYDDIARTFCCYKRMGIVDRESIWHTRPVRNNSNVYTEGGQFMERFDYKMRARRLAYARLSDN
jgi:hypothetical protein